MEAARNSFGSRQGFESLRGRRVPGVRRVYALSLDLFGLTASSSFRVG